MEKIILNVQGMSCEHCVKSVREALEALPGVAKAEVNLKKKTAAVKYDSDKCKPEQIKSAIEAKGYEIND